MRILRGHNPGLCGAPSRVSADSAQRAQSADSAGYVLREP
jgi:hypothetical protein